MEGSWAVPKSGTFGQKRKDDLIWAWHALGINKAVDCYKNHYSKNIVLHSVMEKETHCWPKTLAVTTMEPNFRARNCFLLCPVNHDNDEDDDKVKGTMKMMMMKMMMITMITMPLMRAMMRATYLEHWQRRQGRGLEGRWWAEGESSWAKFLLYIYYNCNCNLHHNHNHNRNLKVSSSWLFCSSSRSTPEDFSIGQNLMGSKVDKKGWPLVIDQPTTHKISFALFTVLCCTLVQCSHWL